MVGGRCWTFPTSNQNHDFSSVKGKPPHVTSVVELWLLAQQAQLLGFSSCGGCREGNKTDAWPGSNRKHIFVDCKGDCNEYCRGSLLLGYQIRGVQGRYLYMLLFALGVQLGLGVPFCRWLQLFGASERHVVLIFVWRPIYFSVDLRWPARIGWSTEVCM